ncbi:MAG TPA: hypothetical protein VL359_11960, partial [bacterium]|nr:hypothetical protein [bacterium]
MIFERAIDDAATMFLFDKRSQQKLDAMAAEASPRSHDRSLIRLTQAAFAFYNMLEAPKTDPQGSMRGVLTILREAKQFREDRVFTTLASKLEVDLMLYMSGQAFLEAEKVQKDAPLLREEDTRALAICEALLRNFPATFNPLPTNWYTSLVPLFPTFREPMLNFYAKRGRDHRTEPLARILSLVKREMITAAGIVQAKRFIMERGIRLQNRHALRTLILGTARDVGMKLESEWPSVLQLVSDISQPRGISPSQMDAAVQVVEAQCQQARQDKDLRKFTGSKLQLGILNFLRESPEECVRDLVETLRASQQISPEDKKQREYRHEEFPDIPFMVGASFLRLNLANRRI